jgi:[acyl-carrier-protein] S-malonyltransferase
MLTAWLELDGVADRLDAFSRAAGTDLSLHGTRSDADTIRDTSVAQPLIVSTSLLALHTVLGAHEPQAVAAVTAGHSVGEFTAAAVAGVLSDTDAVALVTHRATAMARAAAAVPTGMSAVVGGDSDEVLAAVEAAGLTPANVNSAGQVVAAGDLDALARLAAAPPAKARVIPLQVAGAFHTTFMQPALDTFAPIAAAQDAHDPRLALLSNADGRTYGDLPGAPRPFGSGATVLDRLARQIVAPVRWDLCQQTLAAMGVTGLLELAPGGVLTGLARRSLPGVETVAVKSPADLDAARALVARHATSPVASTGEPPSSQENAS